MGREPAKPVTRSSERGAVLAILALMIPVLLGALGLVIDNGYLYSVRRDMQSAADAAAVSAAQEIRRGNTKYKDVAVQDAARNGFSVQTDVSVSVNVPPTAGTFAGDSDYVEVKIRRETPLFFMRALHLKSKPVEARAVAGMRPRRGCVYVLNPSASKALDVGGTAHLETPNCAIQVNSNAANAAVTQGAGTVRSVATQVVGNFSGSGFTPSPETGIAAFSDPLAAVPEPTVSSCSFASKLIITTDRTLSPGTYCGGIEIRKGTTRLNAGTYILRDGGLDVQTNASIIGRGVMFYNTYAAAKDFAPFNIASKQTITLSPPTSGTYRGILFFQDRRVAKSHKNLITRNDDGSFEGFFYFPSSQLRFTGGTEIDVSKIVLISDTLELLGNMNIAGTGDDLFPAAAGDVRVVE